VSRSVDPAAPGRRRRLALTAVPPVLVIFAPFVASTLDDRGPANPWTPTGPGAFMSMLLIEATLLVPFFHYWRLAQVQRALVVLSFAVSGSITVSAVLWGRSQAGAADPSPGWRLVIEVAGLVAPAALGYLAAGRPRPAPETTAALPRHAPTMILGPRQRAIFVVSTWSPRRLLSAAALAAATALTVFNGSAAWQGTALLAMWTVFAAAQARTRLQIDDSGVTVRLPWLPVLRRTVPYAGVRFAEVRPDAPAGRYKLDDSPTGWGVLHGTGPVLALALTDDRWFVYSTTEADTAAALVNGCLTRQRQGNTAPC
jgi:hypothetical protein